MTSTSYPKDAGDWKGVFIRNLVFAFSDENAVDLRLWSPPGNVPDSVPNVCTEAEAAWLNQLMDKGGIASVLRSRGADAFISPLRLLWYLSRTYRRNSDVDVFHVNWLQNSIPLLGLSNPALVTVLGSDLGLLHKPGMTRLLRTVFKRRRCILAPNAEWMATILKNIFGDIAEIEPIIFGIDEAWYSLVRRPPPRVQKWLVVSRITKAKIGPLIEWGDRIFADGTRELHLLGPMQDMIELPSWIHYHGPTHPQALRENWFPIATGLLTVSRHDEGRPQVVLEAMASGLPVLVSDLPAHRTLIAHKRTGWIADDRHGFIEGLRWLSDTDKNRLVGQRAREHVRTTIGTWRDCVGRYVRAYRRLLAEPRGQHGG